MTAVEFTPNITWRISPATNQAMIDFHQTILNTNDVINAAAIVINVSFSANPMKRAAWIPFPGSPRAVAYGQPIYDYLRL